MELKKTPLYEIHKALGARLVPFAGWEMPVQYKGVIEEHLAVRNHCGIFDVSHMGEIEVSGPNALADVQHLTTNDIGRASDGQCQYTLLCYPTGGVVDDTIVCRFNREKFLFCVNASNTDKAYEWIKSNVRHGSMVKNLSPDFAQIALQGPASEAVLKAAMLKGIVSVHAWGIKHFHFVEAEISKVPCLVARTGYTGEDGFEIYLAPDGAVTVWNALMSAGQPHGIAPAGLGARDTLRLEMGYPLYGHELGEDITPIEAGLGKYVRLDKADFIGKGPLVKQSESGVGKTLTGFEMEGGAIARAGYEVYSGGAKAGYVTSGTMSPSLKKGVGMAFVEPGAVKPGARIEIMIRAKAHRARLVRPPFYRKNMPAATA